MSFSAILEGLRTFAGSSNAGQALTVDDIAQPLEALRYELQVIDDVFTTADRNANAAVTAATDAAAQATRMGYDVRDTTERIVNVILPRSIDWLLGYLVSHYFGPILSELTADWHRLAFLFGWRRQIDTWRHKFVDPHIEAWIAFQKWFDGWPRGVVFTVHDWLDHPDHFGDWAAAPVTGPIVAYLSMREHMQTRDNLSNIMLQAWAEQPNSTLERIYTWLLTDK